jgi:exodeoxyribonuclease-3
MRFRLLSYNILHGGGDRLHLIAEVINSCEPDLVLLQEASNPLNIEKLAQATGMADGRSFRRQSLGYLSRKPVAFSQWIRPRISRHAFLEVVPAGEKLRIFGVHLSAVLAAWTEERRMLELRELLRSVANHQGRFNVLAGDFNTIAADARLDIGRLPLRVRPFLWLTGGNVRWRTIKTVIDSGYVDCYRMKHPGDPGYTLPAPHPHVRLDYVFVPAHEAARVITCDVVRHPMAIKASDHLPVMADLDVPA